MNKRIKKKQYKVVLGAIIFSETMNPKRYGYICKLFNFHKDKINGIFNIDQYPIFYTKKLNHPKYKNAKYRIFISTCKCQNMINFLCNKKYYEKIYYQCDKYVQINEMPQKYCNPGTYDCNNMQDVFMIQFYLKHWDKYLVALDKDIEDQMDSIRTLLNFYAFKTNKCTPFYYDFDPQNEWQAYDYSVLWYIYNNASVKDKITRLHYNFKKNKLEYPTYKYRYSKKIYVRKDNEIYCE